MADHKKPTEQAKEFKDIVSESAMHDAGETNKGLCELRGSIRKSTEPGQFILLLPGMGAEDHAVEISSADVAAYKVISEDSSGEKSYRIKLSPSAPVKMLMQASQLSQAKETDQQAIGSRQSDPKRFFEPKSDPPKSDPPKSDPPKSDPPKSDPPKSSVEHKMSDPDPKHFFEPKSDPPKQQEHKYFEYKPFDPKHFEPKGFDAGPGSLLVPTTVGPMAHQTAPSPYAVGPFVLMTYWPH